MKSIRDVSGGLICFMFFAGAFCAIAATTGIWLIKGIGTAIACGLAGGDPQHTTEVGYALLGLVLWPVIVIVFLVSSIEEEPVR